MTIHDTTFFSSLVSSFLCTLISELSPPPPPMSFTVKQPSQKKNAGILQALNEKFNVYGIHIHNIKIRSVKLPPDLKSWPEWTVAFKENMGD